MIASHEISRTITINGPGGGIVFENGKPGVLPLILGESVPLPFGITAIAEVAKPDGATVTVDENFTEIELNAVGRYHLRATVAGVDVDLSFCVCEQAAHDWIPLRKGINQTGDFINRHLVLRSLATHRPAFDGTQASLVSVNLGPYGV